MSDSSGLPPRQKSAELVFKDYHLGLLAQITEYEHRARVAEGRLEAEMTRAYNAECALDEVKRQLATVHSLQRQLRDIQGSMTWKIGRIMMLPVRIIRRILSR